MFVPIDLLKPILADLLASGRGPGPARPWLGINSTEAAGAIAVIRVAPASPAEQASLRRGEVILGLDGEKVSGLPEFYRKLWSCGEVRVKVRLDVLRAGGPRRIEVTSGNRYDYLKLRRSY
jgi:S1-C subfamily serine protease